MSVVVRMEMPKNCYHCDLRYECNAFYAPGKPKPFMKGCMIICQLPKGHGRLVDERELFSRCRPVKNFDNPDSLVIVMRAVIQSQTIVPAEAERSKT